MTSYSNLSYQKKKFSKLLTIFPEPERSNIKSAYRLAATAHNQQRRTLVPHSRYIIHPLRCAIFLMEQLRVKDADMIIAALLHDVIEDTAVTLHDLRARFTARSVAMVSGLTRIKPKGEREGNKFLHKQQKMVKTMRASYPVRLIKSIDLLDNMTSWNEHLKLRHDHYKFPRWQREAETFYFPLARKTNALVYRRMLNIFRRFKKLRAVLR